MSTPFYIQAGISAAEYKQLNQQKTSKSINKQPAGLNFYEAYWGDKEFTRGNAEQFFEGGAYLYQAFRRQQREYGEDAGLVRHTINCRTNR